MHLPIPRFRRRIFLATLAGWLAAPALAGKAARMQLLMIRREGCVYCAQWDREIGPVYARHPEGRALPLVMVDLDGPFPDGLALERMPRLTPSFVLVVDGIEVARHIGYPGKDRFFPVLRGMMQQAQAFR